MRMSAIQLIVHPLPIFLLKGIGIFRLESDLFNHQFFKTDILYALLGKANVELSMTRIIKEVMMKQKEEGDTICRESSAKP